MFTKQNRMQLIAVSAVVVLASCQGSVPPPSCTLRLSPSSISVQRGGSGSFEVTRDSSCGSASVTLSAQNLPANALIAFNPPSGSGSSSTGTISIGSNTNLDIYKIVIVATPANASAISSELIVTVLQ
jgi:hypothetical protein